jgi:hypothetical protein
MFGKKNKGAVMHGVFLGRKTKVQTIFLSLLQPPSPDSSPHTHWTWYKISVWSEMKHCGEGGRGSFVLSAYWKCTVGIFPVWETIYAKLSPISHIYFI